MSAVNLPLIKLRRRQDARPLREETVAGLVTSIKEVGLINPLRVRPITLFEGGSEAEGWEITAGRHRFEAIQRIGQNEAACFIVSDDDIDAEMAMIDENLCRADLSVADRASWTHRRKELYELKHPETRHGATGGGHDQSRKVCDSADRFTASTANLTGKGERIVQLDAERGRKITEEALAKVSRSHLDTGTYLDKLKRVPEAEQVAKVERDLAALPARAPRAPISPAPAPRNEFESEQAWLAKVVKLFDAAPLEWRERARDHLFPDTPIMDARHG